MTLAQLLFLSSTALFAGMSVCVSVVAVPAILASSDPLPSWMTLYVRGRNVAMGTFVVTILTGLLNFFQSGDLRLVLAAILTIGVVLYTGKFMVPTNSALFKLDESGVKSDQNKATARKLIEKWSMRQWVRTALGVFIFILGVEAII